MVKDALRIAELEKLLAEKTGELIQQSEQLSVINSVQEALVQELDMQAIYDLVGEKIRELFDAQGVIISTFDHETETEHFQYAIENAERFYPDSRPINKLRKHLIESRQKIVIHTVEEAVEWFGKEVVPGTKYMQSGVFVPLIAGGVVTSYVSLQNVEKEQAFSDSEIRLLETLANSMSAALQNARLLKETEQRTAELAVINSVQEGLAKELDIQAIYDLVGNRIRELFDAQVVILATFDHVREMETIHYLIEKGERYYPIPRPYNIVRRQLLQKKQKIVINKNIAEVMSAFGEKQLPGTEMPKSVVFVPMMIGEKVVGYASIQNIDQENAFSEADVRLLETLANTMAVALENARLFDETSRLLKETEQQKAELGVINSVQEGLAKELDMQAIYDLVGERIRALFNAQAVIIATFDHDSATEHFKYLIEDGQRFYLASRPYDKLRQHLIINRQKIVINQDYAGAYAKFGLKTLPGTNMTKSGVFVPLIIGDKVNSYISLQNNEIENAFSDGDVRLLETLANSMSVALENARLFDETTRLLKETEQRTAELAVINSVQEGLARELEMQAIYDLVGNKIREVFEAQGVIIATFDHETGSERFNYLFENGERFYAEPRRYDKLRYELIMKKQKILINENAEKAFADFGLKVVPGTEYPKSMLYVPLMVGNRVTSYVSLQNTDKEFAFSDSDVRLLETLANSMSVALENARLFDETNRLLKETEQRTAELAVINSVQEGLAKELDMQGIYELVGDRVQDLFNAQVVIIASFDLENSMEYFNYRFEDGKRNTTEPRPLGKLRLRLIETRKKIVIRNREESAEWFGNIAVPGTKPLVSGVFVPLILGEKITSYVSLQNLERENAFSDSDIRLLETLANSMSVALENARLFDETTRLLSETEQRTAELAVINSVQEGLAKELDMQGIYNLVGDRLCDLFPDTQTLVIRTFDHVTGLEYFKYAIEKGEKLNVNPQPFMWASRSLIENRKPIDIRENYLEVARNHGGKGVTTGKPPQSAVFVPMLVGDLVKGSISLQNVDRENAFNESDLRLLTTLTASMSVALENARLFDETALLLAESKQRAAELSTVNSISKALASLLDPNDLINMVGDQLKNLFNANIVYLAIHNKQTNIISFPYQFGDNMAPLKLGEGLTSKIITTGEPLLINKDMNEQRAQMGVQRIGIDAASYLGVPIPVGEEIFGVLSVQSTEMENRFNENDLRLLTTIASSVGVALRNATLFEDVKQAKMEAEEAGKAAEQANEAKSAFLSTVSHELRTPLTSVLGFAKIIRKRLEEKIFPVVDKSDAKTEKTINQISENLQVVISEGERLTHLINDVLDLAKIEAGKMEWSQETIFMAEVAERAIAATSSLFDQKALKLIREIESDLPEITGDKDKLIQVFINLISNAVKFTDKGSVTCRLYRKGDELIGSVSDTGIGISPEDYGAVFEQFKQVGGDTLTDKPKGTGLGLPICKEIVEHHGGRIWLESEQGKGSTFFFALPVNKKVVAERPMHLNELVQQLKVQVANSKLNIIGEAANILIVDDDDSIRSLLEQELGEAGYNIQQAGNGKEALEKVRNHKPDLIILDIMMPEMNGFDVAAVLKNDPQTMDIPIIVLSVVQDKARGFRIGVDRYLTKPIDTGLLFNEVGSLLEQGKSKRKVMIVDEDSGAVKTLTEVLTTKGYEVTESIEKDLVEKAIANQPDIIIINSALSAKQDIVQTLRFEKGLEKVLFVVYQ